MKTFARASDTRADERKGPQDLRPSMHAAEVAPMEKKMRMTQLGHHPIIWPVVEKWLPPAPGRVLDAGCGEGQLSYRLAKLGYSVTGIDLPGPSLEKARALLASLRGDPKSRPPEALQTQVRQHPLSLRAGRRYLVLAVFSYRR